VLAAAALVSLTAACGPADLGLGAAGTPPPAVGDAHSLPAVEPDEQVPADAAQAPVDETLVPAPAPVAEQPVEPPVEASTEPSTGSSTEPVGDGAAEEAVEASAEPVAVTPEEPRIQPAASTHRRPETRAGRSGGRPEAAGTPVAETSITTGTPAAETSTTTGTTTTGTPVAGSASGGSGGQYTDQQRTTFTAANGQTGRYLRYAGGIDPSRQVGLVVYVDGTGEYGVDNPGSSYALGGPSGLVATAKARNMITLAVESPNQSCECWHTGDTAAYADFLANLVEKQLTAYPIGEVWLAGFSSGAQEITRFLVPRHPELLRVGGGWVVFGGGGPPAGSGAAVTADRMAGVRGHWYTGTADTAVPLDASWGARAGKSWYAARGVTTTSEFPSGVGHGLYGLLGSTVGRLIDAG
jgi:hypothetical protein